MKQYTCAEIAEILGIATNTVCQHARKYRLGKRIGKRLYIFSESDLQFLKNRPGPGNPEISTLRQKTLKKI